MPSIGSTSTTDEVLREVGSRINRYRLQQNRTIDDLAAAAGVSTRTAVRAEHGESPTLATLIKLLRALGRLDALDALLPVPLVSPLQVAALGRERQRARSGHRAKSPPRDRGSAPRNG